MKEVFDKVVPRGLESRTLRLLAVRFNQLSYEPDVKEVVSHSSRLLPCRRLPGRGPSLVLASGYVLVPEQVPVQLAIAKDATDAPADSTSWRTESNGRRPEARFGRKSKKRI